MRFIHTRTRELRWFDEHECPRYAILSHTWGKSSEEVTLQEFEAILGQNPRTLIDPILSKPGYCKIQEFCDEANRMQFDWVWVDTCCIDKTSSAELSEAINCMYRLYEQSALCLVWLRDVNVSDINLTAPESEFRRSKWFTRGWTLQELIAPTKLLFYNKSWTCIGDRSTLAPFIEEICGVPAELFSSSKLSDYSIAQRMSWAAKRVTTRREDIAYCLLGLFEINMPLIYGEADAAFQRLQKKIIKKSNDQTIFAWGFCLPDEMVFSSGSLRLTSILADSPARFEGSGDIVPYRSNTLSFAHYSYQLTKEGIRINIKCKAGFESADLGSANESRFTLFLFCTRLNQDSSIGIRIQVTTEDKEPFTNFDKYSSFLFPQFDNSRQNHVMVSRIAGCKPLDNLGPLMLASCLQCEAFLAIDVPRPTSETPGGEVIQDVTISPYCTIIIPDLEGLTVKLLQSRSQTQIAFYNGYFTISKTSKINQADSPFLAIFTCSLAGYSPAHTNSTTLYMMITNKPIGLTRPSHIRRHIAWGLRPRCLFALSELGAEDLSAEKLCSLAWTPTIIFHNTTVSTRETNSRCQKEMTLISFTLNGQSLAPPQAIVKSVLNTDERRYVRAIYYYHSIFLLHFVYGMFPALISMFLATHRPRVAAISIYLLANKSIWSEFINFKMRRWVYQVCKLLYLLLPVLGVIIAGFLRGF